MRSEGDARVSIAVVAATLIGVAAAQCGYSCFGDNDCVKYGVHCSKCNTTDGNNTCIRGSSCGGNCLVNYDCEQSTNCTICSQGVCDHGCGQKCKTTAQCQSYGCQGCVNGTCQFWSCNLFCMSDAGCSQGSCTFCDPTTSTCKSLCGGSCFFDSDCPNRCPFCNSFRCNVFPDGATRP